MRDTTVQRLRALAARNCPHCGATFGHGAGCPYGAIDTALLKAPVEWPAGKREELHIYQDAHPMPPGGSFEALRESVRRFIGDRYPNDHQWARR